MEHKTRHQLQWRRILTKGLWWCRWQFVCYIFLQSRICLCFCAENVCGKPYIYQQHRETEKDGCYHSTDIYNRVLFIYQIEEEVYTVECHVKTNIIYTMLETKTKHVQANKVRIDLKKVSKYNSKTPKQRGHLCTSRRDVLFRTLRPDMNDLNELEGVGMSWLTLTLESIPTFCITRIWSTNTFWRLFLTKWPQGHSF